MLHRWISPSLCTPPGSVSPPPWVRNRADSPRPPCHPLSLPPSPLALFSSPSPIIDFSEPPPAMAAQTSAPLSCSPPLPHPPSCIVPLSKDKGCWRTLCTDSPCNGVLPYGRLISGSCRMTCVHICSKCRLADSQSFTVGVRPSSGPSSPPSS